ncbi:hypothetical protein HanIR_Chr10g0485761 [Helianthus annuus]|nr:hypothetical protein HanIR_Chr10g0485761 [Helianthus annuus]
MFAWWKGMEDQFSILATITRDPLTVQASTTISASIFFYQWKDYITYENTTHSRIGQDFHYLRGLFGHGRNNPT